jgi:hypothetical protein
MSEPPSAEDPAVQAQRALLAGLRRADDLSRLEQAVRRTSTKGFTPDLAVLQVAVSALDLAGVDRNSPIAKGELVSTHLPEINFRNQRALQERTTYALNAVAAIRGGLEPDFLEDTYWWRTRDIVQYAVIAATAYDRACAQRRGQTLQEFVDDLERSMSRKTG